MRVSIRSGLAATAALAFAMLAGPALAESIAYHAELTPGAMVPPANSDGSGSAEVTYDPETRVLTWTIVYEGLSGPPTAAHFHGPADIGENAGPVIALHGDLASPMTGTEALDEAKLADLEAGLWYINIHTEAHPAGEIRGQVLHAGD